MRKFQQKHQQTEHTLKELRQSIDSLEKMIQKSHNILSHTKVITHKHARSDSVELRLNSRDKKLTSFKPSIVKPEPLNSINNSFTQNHSISGKKLKTPQKTKPHHGLKFQTKFDEETKEKILICDEFSPTNFNTGIKRRYFQSTKQNSFQKLKTEGFNESLENSLESIEKKTISGTEQSQKPKKIILKKRKDRRLNNLSQVEMDRDRIRRKKIFGNTQNSKYSYNNVQLTKNQISNNIRNESRHYRTKTIGFSGEKDKKSQKQNEKMSLNDFIKKVKNYGFIERYLTEKEIEGIYEYLVKSQIPEYKWPLFVVDQVYEKMQK